MRVVRKTRRRALRGARLGLLLATLALAGCGGREAESAGGGGASTPPAAVRTAPVPSDACGWISQAEVAAILGALDGKPAVVRSMERPEPDSAGAACRYPLALRPRTGQGAVIMQVDVSGGQFRALAQAGTLEAGWDRVELLWTGYSTFAGRLGHVAISVASLTPDITAEQSAALATRVRDALPDLPFPLPTAPMLEALALADGEPLDAAPAGPDPCGLLGVAEVEAVLGKLIVPPYRSADNSPLATPTGPSCTYFTAGHRGFVVRPHWDSGRMMFGMARGTAAAADTLEGPWEAAAANGMTGQLYFLKNDRMLEVGYLTSSTDRAGAVRLARAAVGRL